MVKSILFILVLFASAAWAQVGGRVLSPLTVSDNCELPFGSSFMVNQKLAQQYRITTTSSYCGKKEFEVPGSPALHLFNTNPIPNTSPVFVRNSGKPASIYSGMGENAVCQVPEGSVLHSIGPAVLRPEWVQLDISQRKECAGNRGYISRDLVREEGLENWGVDQFRADGADPEFSAESFSGDQSDTESGTEAVTGHCTDCVSGNPVIRIAPGMTDNQVDKAHVNAAKVHAEKSKGSNPSIENMISYALSNREDSPTSNCFRYVKYALIAGGFSEDKIGGGSAQNAGSHLKGLGFKNLLESTDEKKRIASPFDAPKGAILVYSGDQHGHIEIKVGEPGQGGVVSDYYSSAVRTGSNRNSYSGKNRTLIGVHVPS